MEKILVTGGGLVGSLLSIYMARQGYEVHLFDRYPDFRKTKIASGKSINLTICERGFTALDRVGAGDRVREISVPCYGRMVHAVDGSIEHQPYGNRREAIYSISRNALNQVLLAHALEQPSLTCHFEQKCVEVDLEQLGVTLQDQRSGEVTHWRGDRLFGADGAHSAVRLRLQRTPRFNLVQQHLDQGYKELDAPATPAGDWPLEGHAIHIWPRGDYMLIGFPNLDHSFTLSLHMPFEGDPSFASLRTPADLRSLFERSFPDALPLLPNLAAEYFGRPEASMVTIRCSPWTYRGKVALVGDAAHAMVPSYGQGANSGFEDCSVLADCVASAGDDWKRALETYETLRRPNADAIADLALEHFHELRDLVGDPQFQQRKRIERRINELFPDRYIPLYSLISFTNTPYVEALRRDREQRTLIDRMLTVPGILDRLESEEIRGVIAELIGEASVPGVEEIEAAISSRFH
jgi:kynurenine 3-monooxygenase